MVLAKDEKGISYLLTEVSKFNQGIVYLMVTDSRGEPWIKSINKTDHDTKVDASEIFETAMPIKYNNQTISTIKSGFSGLPLQAFLKQVMTIYLSILSAMIIISLLIARSFLRYTTKPILTLTRIADEISLGNLDIDIVFGQHVNCWEIKQCGQNNCAAYTNTAIQCWFVDGTPCEGYEPKFPQKLEGCRKCEVYKTHKGDEIVQLADSFQHMIYMLKKSQAELEDSHKFQRNLIQNSLIGIIATNEVGIIRTFNRVAENLTGYSEAEAIDTLTFTDLFPRDISIKINHPLIFDYGLELRGFKPTESEILNKHKKPIPVRLSGINLYEEGKHLGKVFFFQDFREIKRLRQELIQSERLAATGQAVASISHSIKNILDGLMGGVYVYKMGKKKNDDKSIENGWKMIENNIELISELVINLLNFAKERHPNFEKCDPHTIVEDVIRMVENKINSKKIEIRSEYKGDFKRVFLDPFALHQCLMNLASNAIDAIPLERPGHIVIRVASENEHGIIFEVSDDGIGMSKEIKEMAFQGMFSTKGSKGTGLGLLVVKKIVSEHGGSLEVVSEEQKGAMFRIWLPQIDPQNSILG
jgi:PAS domain S-box-containing protein